MLNAYRLLFTYSRSGSLNSVPTGTGGKPTSVPLSLKNGMICSAEFRHVSL